MTMTMRRQPSGRREAVEHHRHAHPRDQLAQHPGERQRAVDALTTRTKLGDRRRQAVFRVEREKRAVSRGAERREQGSARDKQEGNNGYHTPSARAAASQRSCRFHIIERSRPSPSGCSWPTACNTPWTTTLASSSRTGTCHRLACSRTTSGDT